MGAHSTLRFSRGKAIDYINLTMAKNTLSDKDLEHLMDVLLESQLYNCASSLILMMMEK